jgi:hypothetical protein
VRRKVEDARPLRKRLADEPEAVLLEIPEAAVDQPRRPRRRPDRQVVAFDQPRSEPARRRVEERPAADDPATDDEHVELPVRKCDEIPPTALEGRAHRSG